MTLIEMWQKAIESQEEKTFISECSESGRTEADLHKIYIAAKADFRHLLSLAGLRQADIVRLYGIPRRTVGDWSTGRNRCADYIRYFLAKDLNLI